MTTVVEKTKPSPLFRWAVLLFISMAMFGNYYVYDSISPLADLLKAQLEFSDSNLGLLNAIYSFPNIIMVLIGGIIIDRIGAKKASILFSSLCMIGSTMTTFSGGDLVFMAAGRLVFGLGAESLIVTITTVIAKWFKGKELSFAFGLNLTVARLGSFAALNSPSWAKALYDSWKGPLLISTTMAAISLIAVIIYVVMDTRARRLFSLPEEQKQEKINWSEIFSFKTSFWYITLLCVTFYSAIFPFQTFAVKFFIEHHGLSREAASFASSVIILASMIGTPLFGIYIDRRGRRATLMILGSLMIVPVYLIMAYVPIDPRWMTAIMGVAFSLVPAAMWPSVALIVEEKKLGTAYGLMTMIQNIGLTTFNVLVGWANDTSTVNGITDYSLGMWFFSITGFVGLTFAYLLRRQETGTYKSGLEM
ncbi:MAG: major facilitator superfamily domain-containing protein 1, partial [Bacteroidales bacterium]|nr:major facilitator superfamily domain-containing protein 1 [Bacteroidales bacterium]